MRGLGQFQISQIKKDDPRVPHLFGRLRSAIDLIESIVLHPLQRFIAAGASSLTCRHRCSRIFNVTWSGCAPSSQNRAKMLFGSPGIASGWRIIASILLSPESPRCSSGRRLIRTCCATARQQPWPRNRSTRPWRRAVYWGTGNSKQPKNTTSTLNSWKLVGRSTRH